VSAKNKQDVASTLMAMERAALDRWSKGDPFGFVEISAPDVVHFDPIIGRRTNDREELARCYETLSGKVANKGYEMIDPKVQEIGIVAVLSYNYITHELDGDKSMNVTAVYRNDGGRWEIIHGHVSFNKGS
jgi:ketosteroid isomerase-like protein